MTDPIDIAEARRICDAATPAPWPVTVWIETDGSEWRATGPGHDSESSAAAEPGCTDEQAAQRDAAFIAYARTALPAALDEIEVLRVKLAASEERLIEHNQFLRDERDAAIARAEAAEREQDDIGYTLACMNEDPRVAVFGEAWNGIEYEKKLIAGVEKDTAERIAAWLDNLADDYSGPWIARLIRRRWRK